MDQGDTEDLSLSPASSQLDQVILQRQHQGDNLCLVEKNTSSLHERVMVEMIYHEIATLRI